MLPILKEVTLEEIFDNTVVNPHYGCHEWVHPSGDEAPGVMIDRKCWKVRRLVWTLAHGELGPRVQVRARCLNVRCVNPDHLVAATKDQHRYATEKECRRCHKIMPTSEFHQGSAGPGYYQGTCKKCAAPMVREIYHRLKRDKPHLLRERKLRGYKLDNGAFLELFKKQGGRCGVCKEQLLLEDYAKPKGWVIDHDHETTHVRGFLCKSCNLMLGAARDNEFRLSAAIEYLRNPPSGRK